MGTNDDEFEHTSRARRFLGHIRHNVIGYVALLVALTMTPVPAFAAKAVVSGIGNGSVTTAKLHTGAVTTAKLHHKAVTTSRLANGAVNSNKLRDGSVTAAKLDASARGFRSIVVRRVDVTVTNNAAGVVTVNCHANEVATGGGGLMNGSFQHPVEIRSYPSQPSSETLLNDGDVPHAWTTRMFNDGTVPEALQGYAVCASM
jgi:hypothetical protein